MNTEQITQNASIIIPVYNQYESLKKVLKSLSIQSIPKSKYQIIVVDDGSSDQLIKETSSSLSIEYDLDITLYHHINKGRATARNTGIKKSTKEVLIFCDADRVPCEDYIFNHLLLHEENECVVVGGQYDIFYKSIDDLFTEKIEWSKIRRFSRQPNYYSRIIKIFDDTRESVNNLYWMSFLVGNSSISKRLLMQTGGFDEDFVEWGFEHFELGLRLQKKGAMFRHSKEAANYHIPHKRDSGFYKNMINKSAQMLSKKHAEVNIEIMKKILFENIDVCEYASHIFSSI